MAPPITARLEKTAGFSSKTRLARSASYVFLVLTILATVNGRCAFAQDDNLRQRVSAAWKTYQDEIKSTSVSGVTFRRGSSWPAEFSLEQVEAILGEHVSQEGINFKAMVSALLDVTEHESDRYFGSFQFLTDGHRLRTDLDTHSYVLEGDNVVTVNRPNRSVVIQRVEQSAIGHLRLRDMRYLPNPTLPAKLTDFSRANQLIQAKGPGLEVQIEPITLFPQKVIYRRENGDVRRLVWQLGNVSKDKKIVFPRARVTANFRQGHLYALHVYEFKQVSLNLPVPESKFHVAAAIGDKIFDYRGGGDRPKFKQADMDCEDVANIELFGKKRN